MFKSKNEIKKVKPILEISNWSLREFVASFLVIFAIASFKFVQAAGYLSITTVTEYIFFGLFYITGMILFKADINPALTLARWVRGTIKIKELLVRLVSQLGGVLLAFLAVQLVGGANDYSDTIYQIGFDISAIDIVMIEGFFISLIVVGYFTKINESYKPYLVGSIYILGFILTAHISMTFFNFWYALSPSILTMEFKWPIMFYLLGHASAVFIMVVFWIKDSWSD